MIVTPILECERLSRFWQSSSPHKKGSVFILKDLYWTMIQYTCFNFKNCCSPNIASWQVWPHPLEQQSWPALQPPSRPQASTQVPKRGGAGHLPANNRVQFKSCYKFLVCINITVKNKMYFSIIFGWLNFIIFSTWWIIR